jgi:hypothetical protein
MTPEFIVQCVAFAAGIPCGIIIRMCFEFAKPKTDNRS